MNLPGLLGGVTSHLSALGIFERVMGHEPKAAPGSGLMAAVWADHIQAIPAASGLDSSSALVVFNIRVYMNMLAEPQDDIDQRLLAALDQMFAAYHADFELNGVARDVDLLGEFGSPLSARFGYVSQDKALYRVAVVTLPVVINDAWTQEA